MPITQHLYPAATIALLTETFCITYGLHFTALTPLFSIFYTVSGLMIVWLTMKMPDTGAGAFMNNNQMLLKLSLIVALLWFMCWFGYQRMLDEPLSYESADMLPIIKVMNERLLSAQWSRIYDAIPGIWHGTQPIYLPAMWLPFALPVAAGVDPRWLTVICMAIVVVLMIMRVPLVKKQLPLFIAALALCCWLFTDEIPGLLPFSEEGVVIVYYVLLVLALQRRNAWLTGFFIALCLLSRYALIGWIPALGIYLHWNKDWKSLWKIIAAVCIFVLALLLIPFGWKTVTSLLSLPGSYIGFAARVWKDSPEVFRAGPGLARFFGAQHISLQHTVLLIGALLLPILFMLIALINRKRWGINESRLPIAVLKLTLVIFFSLIDVPYLYLFYTSSFVSLFMLMPMSERNKSR